MTFDMVAFPTMAWIHLDSENVDGVVLDLYQDGGDYMIRAGGWELMNSRCHRSEDVLAELTFAELKRDHFEILIGGLGLGYTAAAFAKQAPNETILHVVERSEAVIRWHEEFFQHRLTTAVARRHIRHADVVIYLRESREASFDAVVLDVDNGPEAICGESNAWLYSDVGLTQIKRVLKRDGALLVWSGFSSPKFVREAVAAGWSVQEIPIDLRGAKIRHFIYLCRVGVKNH